MNGNSTEPEEYSMLCAVKVNIEGTFWLVIKWLIIGFTHLISKIHNVAQIPKIFAGWISKSTF